MQGAYHIKALSINASRLAQQAMDCCRFSNFPIAEKASATDMMVAIWQNRFWMRSE